ncbi:uncharacterized protein LOC125074140 [Vanessa atalanta]|uniref:uncharacterized protein LOC125074140 n=1 Tax=Vanessa atalanta TaxID=42275 RepID=UPI001FCCC599|nr:uncharacterized protein LOC125074140 [Vanessa atalanta]
MNHESSSGLKDLLDTTSDCMHELSNLGINVDSWDPIVIYVVSLKLDAETRKQWELHANSLNEDLPTLTQFKDFLESRFRALEFMEPSKNKAKLTPNAYQTKSLHAASDVRCPHCTESHKLWSCGKFAKEDVNVRQDIVKSLGLCYNCLGNNHTGKICRVPTTCRICKRKHHTLLHGKASSYTVTVATDIDESDATENEQEETYPESSNLTNEVTNSIISNFATKQTRTQTLLATALIKAESKNGSPQILRALLDQGSQASFISEAAVQLLGVDKIDARSCISGVGGGQGGLTTKYAVKVNIQSLHDTSFQLQVQAHVLKRVTSVLPERKFVLPFWADLGQIDLADPQYNLPNKIDILLGAEVYCNILKQGLKKHPTNCMIAQNTYLGWVLSGQVDNNEKLGNCLNVVANHAKLEENELLKQFWELEAEPNMVLEKVFTPEEEECERHFATTTCRDETGRYVVELPFRRTKIFGQYGDTRKIAVNRLIALEKRLSKNLDQKENYQKVIKEYMTLGHMEPVRHESAEREGNEKVWLPHHAVIRPDKSTTKTRIVFNASDRSANGISLNDTLMVGPTLQLELRQVIMRWRLHPICLTADIIKMYRQVKVAKRHVDYQRIVWRDDSLSEIKDFRLLRVTFGTSCAPYLAVKVLQQIAIDEGEKYPLAAGRVKTDFYIDDLMTGCQSETEAKEIYKQMNDLLEKGGFKLQKWTSNREELMKWWKEENIGIKDREIKEDSVTKILGLTWNRCSDTFHYVVKMPTEMPETKRQIIAEICRLYDPLGWIAPCVVTAKVFIQKLWLAGLDWDVKLPSELLLEWNTYRKELCNLSLFQIPRWVQKADSDIQVELHGFSDASTVAYSAVVYLRCITALGQVESHLLSAKTKVAPVKQVSVPRLELCGAVLLTKLLVEVSNVLKIDKANLHAWTDSTIVLAWLSDHPSRWKTFVANRTSEILTRLDAAQWSYVKTKDNPADCASRGVKPSDLISDELWKCGPAWLRNNKIEYMKPLSICTKTDLETRLVKAHMEVINPNDDAEDLTLKFSSLRKLIRTLAYCRRFLRLKNPNVSKDTPLPYLTATELQDTLISCVRQHQFHLFADERRNLVKSMNVGTKSKIKALNPFLDKFGLLRVGGRMENSELPDNSKHPIIINGDSHIAKLIVTDAHEKTLHGGQQLMCNLVRTKYWVTNLKNLAKRVIHTCIACTRNAAKFRTQLMGQLPPCRVIPDKPFANSGVDYAGPIAIRTSKGRGHKSHKGYICLFVCMATRAVHIEAVSDLTTEGFLAAFKRFVARRGRCNHLWSDNGTNFVGASRELKNLFSHEKSSIGTEIAALLANNGTEWHFIPPYAPNFGGLWEAGIKSTKHHLRRVIGDSTLTYEELSTVLAQIEACLNSRPLSVTGSDPDNALPLTPGHFLVGEPLLTAPDHSYANKSISSLRRWQLTQKMLQCFWKRWSQEYLTHFFQRYKWNVKIPELKIGDVVLVREDGLPPAKWLCGRVVNLHPGRDKLTRVVSLKYKNTIVQRPASKVCPLPLAT